MIKNIFLTFSLGASLVLTASAQMIHYAAQSGAAGKATSSAFVTVDDQGTIASVVELHSDPKKAELEIGGKKVPLKFIVNNAESRVALYSVPEESRSLLGEAVKLVLSHSLKASDAVSVAKPGGEDRARFVGRVHRFQGKVLPLAVLRINHKGKVPAPGTGIYNEEGKLVALVRQQVYNAKQSSYCLPSEVITRIAADHRRNGRVSRCWIGIIMDELIASPVIESVRPDSPANKAGIKKGDIILSIDGKDVAEYAQVVDSFFYLIAGESQKFRVLRGTEVMEFEVTPQVSPGR